MQIVLNNIISPELDDQELRKKHANTGFYVCDFCGWVSYDIDAFGGCPNCECRKKYMVYPDTAYQFIRLNADQRKHIDSDSTYIDLNQAWTELKKRITANHRKYWGKKVTLRELLSSNV